MYRRVMAFDYDGTLAVDGRVPPEVEAALETGRRFETVVLGGLGDLLAGIVWENGAVLTHMASGESGSVIVFGTETSHQSWITWKPITMDVFGRCNKTGDISPVSMLPPFAPGWIRE